MAPPGVGHQAQVVAHQPVAGAQGAAAHRGRRLGRTFWVVLPALDAARQLEHGALGEGMVAVAGDQPGAH